MNNKRKKRKETYSKHKKQKNRLKNRNIFSYGLFFYRICQDTKRIQPDLN